MGILDEDAITRLSEEIPMIRERYKVPKDFDKTILVENKTHIISFGKSHYNDKEMKFVHASRDFDDDNKEKPFSYFYDGEDFKVFAEYVLGSFFGYAIIFIKNMEAFNSDFYLKKVLFYDKGIYNLINTNYGYALVNIKVEDIAKPLINDSMEEKIIENIDNFFKNKEFYIKNEFPFKRGMLLYGPPGNGKTMLIRYILTKFTDKYGIVVDCSKGLDGDLISFLDLVLGDEQRILILEDIDGIETYHRSVLLNILDGIESMNNSLIVATTNFPEKLDIGLTNRPSRFDEFFNINIPNPETRKKLLQMFFKDINEEETEEYVKLTDGFCGSYFKELFITCNIKKVDIIEGIKILKEQLKFNELISKEDKMFG